jgi:hypothetical protein
MRANGGLAHARVSGLMVRLSTAGGGKATIGVPKGLDWASVDGFVYNVRMVMAKGQIQFQCNAATRLCCACVGDVEPWC